MTLRDDGAGVRIGAVCRLVERGGWDVKEVEDDGEDEDEGEDEERCYEE